MTENKKDIPPEQDRAKTEEEALKRIAEQDLATTPRELNYYLNTYYQSLEIAKLVARHPNCNEKILKTMLYFLPEDARQNPALPELQKDEAWEEQLRNAKPVKAQPWHYEPSPGLSNGFVSRWTPWRYKIDYWLKYGDYKDRKFISKLEYITADVRELLCKDKSAPIRKSFAKKKFITLKQATILSKDKAKTVRQALAENENCPADILSILAWDDIEKVKMAARKNKSCPPDVAQAAKLAATDVPPVSDKPLEKMTARQIITILGDKSTFAPVLEKLAESKEAYVRAGVALHENCPQELLERLLKDKEHMVKECVLTNPSTAEDLLSKITAEGNKNFYRALIMNPSLPESDQLMLIKKTGETMHRLLADSTDYESVWAAIAETGREKLKNNKKINHWMETLIKVLDANHTGFTGLERSLETRYYFVSKIISRHPKCPSTLEKYYAYYLFDSLVLNPKIALELLEDPNSVHGEAYADWKVDQWLSEGIAPGHVTNYYLQSDDLSRCRKASRSWNASPRFIQPLVLLDDIHIKKSIAERKENTRFMFEVMARDRSASVREIVAKNYKCHPAVLSVLAQDKTTAVKAAAVQNRNYTPDSKDGGQIAEPLEYKNKGPKKKRIRMAEEAKDISILEDLAGDKLPEVREAVASNKKTPVTVLAKLAQDEDSSVRSRIDYNDNTTDEILETLCRDIDNDVRYFAFLNLNSRRRKRRRGSCIYDYDESLLALFYDDTYERIQCSVARCTTNADIQKRLGETDNEKVHLDLASNPHLDNDVAWSLSGKGSEKITDLIIKHAQDVELYFRLLEKDKKLTGQMLGEKIALNPELIKHKKVHLRFAYHPQPGVRASIAAHVRTDELLTLLAKDDYARVRWRLTFNTRIKLKHILLMLEKPHIDVIKGLHDKHKDLLNELMTELLPGWDDDICCTIARNYPYLNKAMEKIIVKHPSPEVRLALAGNDASGVSVQAQKILKDDPDQNVRQRIKERFNR